MDKYEYKLKLDQIKALAAEGDYASAAEIADTVNWRKIKNVNLLVKAGDVYIKQKRYEEAKEILLMAYDRSPIGRMFTALPKLQSKQRIWKRPKNIMTSLLSLLLTII